MPNLSYQPQYTSEADYLAAEAVAEYRSEYIDGEIYAMADPAK